MKDSPYQTKEDPWSSHSKIVLWLNDQKKFREVVEVGCATGIIGKRIVNRNFRLNGIEVDEDWANEAQDFYDEIIVASVESVSKKFFQNTDCVIFGDVLEHLVYPHSVLKNIVDASPEYCHFVISVPNIANIWIRLQLLFGKFDYTERGILDQNHLHFFTLKSLLKLIETSKLIVYKTQFTPIPLNLLHPFFYNLKIGRFLHARLANITNFFPRLLSYQIIVYCKKEG